MTSYTLFWLAVLVACLIAEAATVTLASIWFAAGALAAILTVQLHGSFAVQAVVFFAVSIVFLVLLRPFARKMLKPQIVKTNADALIGTTGVVLTEIDNTQAQGQVKLEAMEWTARSTSGEVIPAGAKIRVDRIEGVKVYVSTVEIPATV